jgi:hypothetical protein
MKKKISFIDRNINPSFKLGFERGKVSENKRVIKIINNFEPTKSNMMYDEVLRELKRLLQTSEEKQDDK